MGMGGEMAALFRIKRGWCGLRRLPTVARAAADRGTSYMFPGAGSTAADDRHTSAPEASLSEPQRCNANVPGGRKGAGGGQQSESFVGR